MKKALFLLAGTCVVLGLAGCGEKPKEPTARDVGKGMNDAIKQGADATKEAEKEVDKAVKDATK